MNQKFIDMFKINITAINLKDEQRHTPPIESIVDTGSGLTWLPKQLLLDIGIHSRGKKRFFAADGKIIERNIGYAILTAEGYFTSDEVVFAETGDLTLLGVRTLDGFGVTVDNIKHRFVAKISVCTTADQTRVTHRVLQ